MTELLDIFRALADPTRMRIMHLLGAMELSVGEVAQAVAQSQPRVSRHVKILAEAGLVDRRKEGNWVFLRIGAAPACAKLMVLFDGLSTSETEGLWLKADLARLAAIRADRVRAADEYFARHADEWDAIRSLYVPEAQVEAAMSAILGDAAVQHLLDLGTGTGRMIQLFGAKAGRVSAIDRSPDMLRLARAKLPPESADRVDLLLGDFCALPLDDASADLVVSNPPYVSSGDCDRLPAHVRDHEPRLALDGGPDGLRVISRLVSEAARVIVPSGRLMMEIGDDQAEAVREILCPENLFNLEALKCDCAGRVRLAVARRVPAWLRAPTCPGAGRGPTAI